MILKWTKECVSENPAFGQRFVYLKNSREGVQMPSPGFSLVCCPPILISLSWFQFQTASSLKKLQCIVGEEGMRTGWKTLDWFHKVSSC